MKLIMRILRAMMMNLIPSSNGEEIVIQLKENDLLGLHMSEYKINKNWFVSKYEISKCSLSKLDNNGCIKQIDRKSISENILFLQGLN